MVVNSNKVQHVAKELSIKFVDKNLKIIINFVKLIQEGHVGNNLAMVCGYVLGSVAA